MMPKAFEFEGTWEEIAAQGEEWAGRRVRLTVLAGDSTSKSTDPTPRFRPASGRSIFKHAGTWEGDDLEECIRVVRATRAPAEF